MLGVLSFFSRDVAGILGGLLVGVLGTVASSLYNPCGCCGGAPAASSLRISGILSAVVALTCFGLIIFYIVAMAQLSGWEAANQYVCCPSGATTISDACNQDCKGTNQGDPCWYSPAIGEVMQCEGNRVPIETGETGYEDFIAGVKTFALVVLGIALVLDLCAGTIAAAAGYFTMKESKEVGNIL